MLQCWSTETVCAGRGRQEYIVLLWESFKHYKTSRPFTLDPYYSAQLLSITTNNDHIPPHTVMLI